MSTESPSAQRLAPGPRILGAYGAIYVVCSCPRQAAVRGDRSGAGVRIVSPGRGAAQCGGDCSRALLAGTRTTQPRSPSAIALVGYVVIAAAATAARGFL